MPPNKIPLREIERAITINAAIDQKASKALTFPKWQTGINQGIGRCIFIYIAHKSGYIPDEICDYLTITLAEYDHKFAVLDDLCSKGKELFNCIGNNSSYSDTYNTHLVFYRKLLLAQNYLRYRFGYQP